MVEDLDRKKHSGINSPQVFSYLCLTFSMFTVRVGLSGDVVVISVLVVRQPKYKQCCCPFEPEAKTVPK